MKVIYAPKGRAKEYAELALNIYNGCTHGCTYCYASRYDKENYYETANPKKDFLKNLKQDIKVLNTWDHVPEICLSFQGDVYQHAETELKLTRSAIELLIENNLPFTVLTKSGSRAARDFDLLSQYDKCRFGTSLVFTNPLAIEQFEPDADDADCRIQAIIRAHELGIPTWVSLEPVIYPEQALMLVKMLCGFVDSWKVGKINHHPELEKDVDWIQFRQSIIKLFEHFGCDYYIKKSLSEL